MKLALWIVYEWMNDDKLINAKFKFKLTNFIKYIMITSIRDVFNTYALMLETYALLNFIYMFYIYIYIYNYIFWHTESDITCARQQNWLQTLAFPSRDRISALDSVLAFFGQPDINKQVINKDLKMLISWCLLLCDSWKSPSTVQNTLSSLIENEQFL